jgi:cyclopropane-fatty-acyl-phospholipid synthase
MGERVEAPDGMAGIIRYERDCGAHYGTPPGQKKRPMTDFRKRLWNPKPKPRFDIDVIRKTAAFHRLKAVFRLPPPKDGVVA